MKRTTDALRLITAVLLGISAGIGLVQNIRRLIAEETVAAENERRQ